MTKRLFKITIHKLSPTSDSETFTPQILGHYKTQSNLEIETNFKKFKMTLKCKQLLKSLR